MPSLLPSNRTDFEESLESSVSRPIPQLINTLWNPVSCPVELLDYLAWGLGITIWESAWSELVKRDVIANSINVAKKQGTPWALFHALSALGYDFVRIDENFDSAGNPIGAYQFDVILNVQGTITQAVVDEIRRQVNFYKNARSHLRDVITISQFYDGTYLYNGGITYNGGIV